MKTWTILRAIVMLSFTFGIAQHARAQDTDPNFDYYKEPGLYPTRSYLNQHFNEHIDPHTGRLQHHYVDLYIPGNGGFDLKIQRSYTNVDESGVAEPTPFGVGWTMHFGRVLRKASVDICFADFEDGFRMPVLELPDGSRQILFRDDTYFLAQSRFVTTNRWRAECMSSPTGLLVYSPDGTRYEMTQRADANAPFGQQAWYTTRIVDRNGNYMTISYQSFSGFMVPGTLITSDGRTVTYSYTSDANGVRLTSISDGTRTWQYEVAVVPSVGLFLQTVTPPAGGAWHYTYKSTGGSPGLKSMTSVTYPQGGTINYSYIQTIFAVGVQNTVVSGKTTSDGGAWTFSYIPSIAFNDPDTTTVTALNGTTTYQHVGYGTVETGTYWRVGLLLSKQQTDPGQSPVQTETYTWTSQLISNQDNRRPGSTLANDLDTRAPVLQTKVISRDGNTYTTDYSNNFDAYGNPLTVTESSSGFSRTINLTYQYQNSISGPWIIHQVKDETILGVPNFSITRIIDTRGNVTQENRFGVPTNYTYDPGNGNLLTRTDARGAGFTTEFSNHKRGIPQTEIRPVPGNNVTRVISNEGNVTTEMDGKGDTIQYRYDGLNRLQGNQPGSYAITYPFGNPVSITYPSASQMVVARGTLTQTVNYDGFGRMASVVKTDSASPSQNSTINLAHNAVGQRIYVSYPNAGSGVPCPGNPPAGTCMDYDMLDRIKTVKHPGPATRTYNYGATTVAITNERNITHTYSYRAYGDPDKRELMSISVPEPGANVTITRNPIGRILTVAQGDKTRAYVYNAVGQVPAGNFLTSIIDPETDTTTFGRDQVGNMTSRSVNGTPTTGFIYDALNRLTQINYPGGLPTVIRSYYGDGLLKDVEYGTAALRHFEYDANKNLTLDRLTVDGRIYSLGHSYSGNDGRSTTTFPSGTVVSFNPNGFGRPRAATPFAGNIDFHPSGELKTVEYANGVTTSIALNNRLWPQQLASLRSTPPLVDLKHTYTYDGTGNVKSLETRVDDIVDGLNSMPDLQYDAIDRLVLANTTSGEARAFSYDGAGNLLSQTKGGQILNYGYDGSNRLASISNRPYQFAYDLYGNVVNNGTASTPMFTYNDALQMTCFRCGQTDPVNYAYDGLNMRVRTEKGGIKTYFMYGLDGQLLLEDTPTTSSWGSDLKEYVYLQGKLVGVKAITRVGTATTTSTGSISSLIGGNVTLTVNVSGSSPTGTVTFKEGGVPFGSPVTVTNGSASITLSSLSVGSHTITADYSGDANNAQSSTTFQVTIYNLSWLPAILQLLLDD